MMKSADLVFIVAKIEGNECYTYLYTTDKEKADLCQKQLSRYYNDIEIIAHEMDQPVWLCDFQRFSDGAVAQHVIKPGIPEADERLDKVRVIYKERIV